MCVLLWKTSPSFLNFTQSIQFCLNCCINFFLFFPIHNFVVLFTFYIRYIKPLLQNEGKRLICCKKLYCLFVVFTASREAGTRIVLEISLGWFVCLFKYNFFFFSQLGVDIEAARKEEERIMLRDARQWLNSGRINDVRHAKSGGTALHVAAAKGYTEVLK